MGEEGAIDIDEQTIGLCARCLHARVQEGARGRRYWRCDRAEREPGYLRYPPLPLRLCPGHEDGRPTRAAD